MGATFATGAVPLVLTVIALIAGTMGLGMVGHFPDLLGAHGPAGILGLFRPDFRIFCLN
jgi:hypothetical protein